MLKTFLPKSITLPNGRVLNQRISYIPGVSTFSKNGMLESIKRRGGRYRLVQVLGRNLRGKLNLHGRPYEPSTWILTDVDLWSEVDAKAKYENYAECTRK